MPLSYALKLGMDSDTENSTGNLFEKEGIQLLEPNAQFEATFSIEIL